MMKILCILLAAMLALGLLGCGTPAVTEAPTPEPAAEQVVVFADPALEAMVRASLGKPEGDITAAEAEAVTELNLSFEWRRYLPDETPIEDIGGLEYFKNLEALDLSYHAIADITPLAGLKKLTLLSLGGNPVADIAPLADLTNLKGLILSGCAARDYGPLASLVNLNFLSLDHAAISDLTPLAALTSLKRLYLAGSPASDYSPLAAFYPNLEERDFTIISTLQELGFAMDNDKNQASYGDVQRDGLSVNINHAEWGAPQTEDMTKCVRTDLMLDSGYILAVLYYPEIAAYVFQMNINGKQMNYIYNAADGTFMMDSNNRERFERMITEALGETDAEDTLLAPIPIFNDAIRTTFGMTADALYALSFEQTEALPASQPPPPYAQPYEQIGFTAYADSAVCLYEQTEPHDMQIAIHRPEWGVSPNEWNIEFHDSNVNGYNLVMQYFAHEGKWHVYLEKDGAECWFDDYPATDTKGWEYPDIETVHQMAGNAFGSKGKELYYRPLEYFEQWVQKRFGMGIDELYALPVGE